MPKPVRIIIDIADEESFDWDETRDLWSRFFRSNQVGHNGGKGLTYRWWKEYPEPTGKFRSFEKAEVAELKEQIDALEHAIYRLKRKYNGNETIRELVENKTKLDAMFRTTKSLYSRWNAIDAQNTQVSELAG